MTAYALSLLDRLPTAIAVVAGNGAIQYRNDAFEDTFGTDAKSWLKDAARAVAGERGWLQGFFLDNDETLDVEIEGRVYRVDQIMKVDGHETPAVALSFEDVTKQREMEQAKSDFTSMIVHDL
ncbi:MAG TPA: hypothetical protein VF698_04935, partial [Thermoanaerobaculia bacterium]